MSTIIKLYISNALTGLVFWYGIEKLFMQSIGINAFDIGLLSGVVITTTLLLDIPSGMLADRWSRKGLLALSALFLALSGVFAATSQGLSQYIIAYILYGCYLVSTSGTYQAITYDTLHEQGRAKEYSKIMGRCWALFLCGAGVANIASGFLAQISLTFPFWLTLVSCGLNILLILSIKEPTFHKKEQKEQFIRQVGRSAHTLMRVALLRSLTIVWCAIGVGEVFKQDFSQLYALQFIDGPILLGLLWAAYAFAWATGHFIAHRLTRHLHTTLIASFGLLMLLGLVAPSPWGMLVFMFQATIAAATITLIETHVQDATPSGVRASVISVLSTTNRLISLPVSILLGWTIATYDVFWAIRAIAVVATIALSYWLLVGGPRLAKSGQANKPVAGPAPEIL